MYICSRVQNREMTRDGKRYESESSTMVQKVPGNDKGSGQRKILGMRVHAYGEIHGQPVSTTASLRLLLNGRTVK